MNHPMPGDCIRLSKPYHGHPPGSLAFISGNTAEASDIYPVAFADTAYRDQETISAHGAPTYLIPAGVLVPTSEVIPRTCWKWKSNGRHSGHPEQFLTDVTVWHLDPSELPYEFTDALNKANYSSANLVERLMGWGG